MNIVQAELFTRADSFNTVYVCTTNSIVNSRGMLIMGRGSALEMRKQNPVAQSRISRMLKEMGYKLDGTEDYGFILCQAPSEGKFGWGIFQTKRDWKNKAVLETIKLSVEMLNTYATEYPDIEFRVPYPAVGCGQIGHGTPVTKQQVDELISVLPDNVTFYRK